MRIIDFEKQNGLVLPLLPPSQITRRYIRINCINEHRYLDTVIPLQLFAKTLSLVEQVNNKKHVQDLIA